LSSAVKALLCTGSVLILCACETDADYDAGYDDGYAAGYNTTCEIGSTLIEGDWNNSRYPEGYAQGYENGSQECLRQRKQQ
jgi:hypothetical protein